MLNLGNVYLYDNRQVDFLSAGITTAAIQPGSLTDYIFAGTAATGRATLQFLGSTNATDSYSIGSVNAIAAYGTIAAGYRADVTIQNGINALASHLAIQQTTGSLLTINGNDVIDFNSGT